MVSNTNVSSSCNKKPMTCLAVKWNCPDDFSQWLFISSHEESSHFSPLAISPNRVPPEAMAAGIVLVESIEGMKHWTAVMRLVDKLI
jgi:hypothetical protein